MPKNATTLVFLGLMVLMLVWMGYSGRRARAKMAAQRESLIEVGANIMTTAGFYGTIVDIDGDAITLQSPAGDETVWNRQAIARLAELPLAEDADESEPDEDGGREPLADADDLRPEASAPRMAKAIRSQARIARLPRPPRSDPPHVSHTLTDTESNTHGIA